MRISASWPANFTQSSQYAIRRSFLATTRLSCRQFPTRPAERIERAPGPHRNRFSANRLPRPVGGLALACVRILDRLSTSGRGECWRIFWVFRRADTAILPRIPACLKTVQNFSSGRPQGLFDSSASTAKINFSLTETNGARRLFELRKGSFQAGVCPPLGRVRRRPFDRLLPVEDRGSFSAVSQVANPYSPGLLIGSPSDQPVRGP